jgi:hypothetical protein
MRTTQMNVAPDAASSDMKSVTLDYRRVKILLFPSTAWLMQLSAFMSVPNFQIDCLIYSFSP